MKLPKDKNGQEIHPGDTIRLTFNVRQRERPGNRIVAIHGMSGKEIIVSDEGKLSEPMIHWVDYLVEWDGACLIATRIRESDFQSIMSGECTSIVDGNHVSASSAMHYINDVFEGKLFEVIMV